MTEKVEPSGTKVPRPSRMLAVFKAVVLLTLLAMTTYGMLNGGLYADALWLPVTAGVMVLFIVTLFMRGFYNDVPRIGWILVALLAVLVGVKGFSMVWTISETETVKEILRSSTYLATFLVALAALTSGRQIGPITDVAVLMVTAVAGYGLLQKINPIEYPIYSIDGVRIDSTLEYVNTFAAMLGMGVVLALARIVTIRNAVLRGLYAVLILAFLAALYLTASRGGIGALGAGMIVLFILASNRLQIVANLLLVCVPGAWLFWQMQGLEALFQVGATDQQKLAAGAALRTDLIVALVAVFVLQAGYALLANRFELMPLGRRVAGALVLAGVLLVAGTGAFMVVSKFGGVGQTLETLLSNPYHTEDVGMRLASLSPGYRAEYWAVAWEAWKERPFTGTGAGTFQYTWLENRSGQQGVKQVHNLYLEQGTETGVFAFLALAGFAVLLLGYAGKAAWRSGQQEERRLLLTGLTSTLTVYLASSALEWHWYIMASTLFFFILAGVTVKAASREELAPEADAGVPDASRETLPSR